MIRINFYLKSGEPNKKGLKPLFAQFVHNYKNIRTTIAMVKPTQWNKTRELMKLPAKQDQLYDDCVAINKRIALLKNATNELNNKALIENRKVTEKEIKDVLSLNALIKESKETLFFEFFDTYQEVKKSTRSLSTIKSIKTARNFFFNFQEFTQTPITFNSIDSNFADAFIDYCFNKLRIDNDYFAKNISVLKSFLSWANKRIEFELNFPEELLQIKEKENDVIFLTLEEVKILLNYEFASYRLNKTKDTFCFACFTGLRHCDLYSLKRENIKNGFIYLTQQKIQENVNIPISKHANKILKKYENEPTPLPRISNQKTNNYLKECLKTIATKQEHKADELFNRKVRIRKVSGRNITENYIPLHEAISFHVGRKTFITNSLMLGVNLQTLQEMGAPKKPKDLKKYLKIVDSFKSQVMQNTWDKAEI